MVLWCLVDNLVGLGLLGCGGLVGCLVGVGSVLTWVLVLVELVSW